MFERYGPSSLKVSAYIKALQMMSRQEFATVDCLNLDNACPKDFHERLKAFKGVRIVERNNAFDDTIDAVGDKGSEDQRTFVGALASILVLDDFLTQSERLFIDFFIIHPKVPLHLLYAGYQKEDEGIEEFCRRLTRMDGETVYVKTRLDHRGQGGEGVPDFVVCRNGADVTVEHTLINVYQKQVFHEKLFAKFLNPRGIEEKIKQAYPQDWVTISIPINAFRNEAEAKRFDLQDFTKKLIEAVGKTPVGLYGSTRTGYEFDGTPFRVEIAKDEGFWDCRLIGVVPANRAQIAKNLEADMIRAIETKGPKLRKAKGRGEKTALLLDCDDYDLTSWETLAEAFECAATQSLLPLLEGIDQVYIQHRGAGCCWILPVKMGPQVYSDLPEFQEYWNRQAEILIGRPLSTL